MLKVVEIWAGQEVVDAPEEVDREEAEENAMIAYDF